MRGRDRRAEFQKEEDDEVVVEEEEEGERRKFEGSDDENAVPHIVALCHCET